MVFKNLKGLTDYDKEFLEKLYHYHLKGNRKNWVDVFEEFHNALIETNIIIPTLHEGSRGEYTRAGLTYQVIKENGRTKGVLGFNLDPDGISFHFFVGEHKCYRGQHYISWCRKRDWCGVLFIDADTIAEIYNCTNLSLKSVLGDASPKLRLPSIVADEPNRSAGLMNIEKRNNDSHYDDSNMGVLPDGCIAPSRLLSISERIIRDSELTAKLKNIYNNECQICGYHIDLPNGQRYAEAHHIFPLSEGGPDISENIICVCPNCHVELDYCVIKIFLEELLMVRGHIISCQYVDYHNDRVK